MFWGLIMEPGKKYSQTVDKSFHISQAALDLTTAQNDPVQVLLGYDDRHYLICTLQKGRVMQVMLDLNFQAGDEISFATNGAGHVHLTGYRVPEDDFMDEEEDDEEAEDEEDIPKLTSTLKRKASEVMKKGSTNVQKKTKMDTLQALNDADDTDDSDDSDVSLSDLLNKEGDLDDTIEEEEGEDDDDEDGDDDDEDDDEESDDDQSEMEEAEPVKPQKQKKDAPKQNGIAKVEKSPKGGKATQPNTPKQQPNTPKQQTPAVKNDKQKTPKENKQNQQQQQQKGQKTPGKDGTPQKKTVEGGVVIEDLKVGEGTVAKPGKFVQVYYEGRLKSNNKMFDSSNKGPGFKFRLGKQEVIKAWDIGVSGMKVGGKRRIVCPPHMAYGAQGSPPVIPPNSTLVFEVELKNVK